MPPEQARGRACAPRSDVFGLGAILCEILTGLPPYRGNDPRGLYKQAAAGATGEALARLDGSGRDQNLVRLA